MATPLIAGLSIAAAALAARYGIAAIESWQTAVRAGGAAAGAASMGAAKRFYEGGFEPKMTRREAALVLGIRELAAAEKVKEAHRKVMIANHPDSGGSAYIAAKVNEAKDLLLGKRKSSSSPFD